MKNKVTVSRAHRLRKREFARVEMKTIYLYKGGSGIEDMFCLAEKGMPPSRLCDPFTLPYEPDLMPNEVVPFDSFDDMCKWVANGKRLEDLCDMEGDGVELGSFPKETRVAFIFRGNPFMLLANGTIFRLEEEGEYPFPNIHSIVYPLGAGDTITIEVTEQL